MEIGDTQSCEVNLRVFCKVEVKSQFARNLVGSGATQGSCGVRKLQNVFWPEEHAAERLLGVCLRWCS